MCGSARGGAIRADYVGRISPIQLVPDPILAALRDPSEVNVEVANVVPTLAGHRYLLLTTYKRDGSAVGTPVWFAADGDALVATTEEGAWKVKRLRRDPRATVAPCDVRGRPLGPPTDMAGEIVEDPSGRRRANDALSRRYGSAFAAIGLLGRVRRAGRAPKRAVLALRPAV